MWLFGFTLYFYFQISGHISAKAGTSFSLQPAHKHLRTIVQEITRPMNKKWETLMGSSFLSGMKKKILKEQACHFTLMIVLCLEQESAVKKQSPRRHCLHTGELLSSVARRTLYPEDTRCSRPATLTAVRCQNPIAAAHHPLCHQRNIQRPVCHS